MRDHAGVDIAGTQIYEGRKEAEERGVRELEQGAKHGDEERDFGVGYAKLVEMVHVGYAKV